MKKGGKMVQLIDLLTPDIVTLTNNERAALSKASITINHLTLTSNNVLPGDAFCALQGESRHGSRFTADAVLRGASAILVEDDTPSAEPLEQTSSEVNRSVWRVKIPLLSQKINILAINLYGNPLKNSPTPLMFTAVTGTNGKTSTVWFLEQLLKSQKPTAIMGTLGYGKTDNLFPWVYTTPDPIFLQRALAQMVLQQVSHIALEASSHALVQNRLQDIPITQALFTNLSHEHLDYHGTFERYGAAKQLLFERPELKQVVLNIDDEFGRHLLGVCNSLSPNKELEIAVVYGKNQSINDTISDFNLPNNVARWHMVSMEPIAEGTRLELETPMGSCKITIPIRGFFQIENFILAVAAFWQKYPKTPLSELENLALNCKPVPGRMQWWSACDAKQLQVIVDYAHTPDALQYLLESIEPYLQTGGRPWVVMGCGGDRSRTKRPLMAKAAESWLAKHDGNLIFTADNPRNESQKQIFADMSSGLSNGFKVTIEPCRRQAIQFALEQSSAFDTVIIAGKGHEDYQEINGVREPFSDAKVINEWLSQVMV